MTRLSREDKETIETAFSEYLNAIQDTLMEFGFDEESSQHLIFASADKLKELKKLPAFPANSGDHAGLAKWLITADHINFTDFVTKTVAGRDG